MFVRFSRFQNEPQQFSYSNESITQLCRYGQFIVLVYDLHKLLYIVKTPTGNEIVSRNQVYKCSVPLTEGNNFCFESSSGSRNQAWEKSGLLCLYFSSLLWSCFSLGNWISPAKFARRAKRKEKDGEVHPLFAKRSYSWCQMGRHRQKLAKRIS